MKVEVKVLASRVPAGCAFFAAASNCSGVFGTDGTPRLGLTARPRDAQQLIARRFPERPSLQRERSTEVAGFAATVTSSATFKRITWNTL